MDTNIIDKHIINPIKNYIDFKLTNLSTWLKINVIDIIELITIVIIISVGLKLFLSSSFKEKDFQTIYITIVIYTIIRLFWRVILNV